MSDIKATLSQIKAQIRAYKVDHDQSDEYNEGFDDGIGYALDIINEHIEND